MRLFIVIALALFMNICERPPVGKDINRNSASPSPMDHSRMQHPMVSSPNAASAPIELQFIDTMIAHHQGAIEMAELADTRAQHDEVKKLAKAIISDQQKEIAKMRTWRSEWYGGAEPAININFPGMNEGMAGMDIQALDRLKANQFDVEFIKQMVPHHQGAIAMAEAVKGRGVHAEIDTLAEQVIKAQSSEVENMKKWLAEWK